MLICHNMRCLLFTYLLVVPVFMTSALLGARDYDYYLERVEPIPGTKETIFDLSNLKVMKKNKHYFLNGTVDILKDIDDNFMLDLNVLYSPLGNSQYIKSPYKIPPTAWCEFFKTTYKRYIESNIMDKTDFPLIPPEGLCPIPKGSYYIKEYEPSIDHLPTHITTGLWKVDTNAKLGDDHVGGILCFVRVTSKFG